MAKQKKKTKKKVEVEKPDPEVKDSDVPEEFSDPKYIIAYVLAAKKEAYDATKERRKKWTELWQLYQNRQDYTDKKSWQSKAFVPKIFMHTIRAAALVERAALQTSTLFKVEIDEDEYEDGEHDEAREKAKKVEKKLKNHLEKTNFAETSGENSISSFLLGLGAIKRRWDDNDPKCTYDNTEVLNLYISPDYNPYSQAKPRYMIERRVWKLAELLQNAEKNPGVYKTDALEKLESSYSQQKELIQKERARKGLSDFSPQDKEVEILEFWGDITSKDGRKILQNQLIMVANTNELIRHHENPFNDELPPWRLTIPIAYPHRGVAGTSLVEGAVPLQYTLNNLINLYMDNLNFTVTKMFEINKDRLEDPQKARRIYPGKVFLKSTDQRVVTEVNTTPVGKEVVDAIRVVDSEFRQATAITEYVEALPSKHKQTLGEIEKKTSESHSFFDVIARRIERNTIAKLIKDTYNLLVQFSDILKGLEGKYIFKVGGLTLLLEQQKLEQYIDKILAAALKSKVLASLTDIPVLWKKMLTQMNLQDAFKEPEEAEGEMTAEAGAAKAAEDMKNLPPEEQVRLLRTMKAA